MAMRAKTKALEQEKKDKGKTLFSIVDV